MYGSFRHYPLGKIDIIIIHNQSAKCILVFLVNETLMSLSPLFIFFNILFLFIYFLLFAAEIKCHFSFLERMSRDDMEKVLAGLIRVEENIYFDELM